MARNPFWTQANVNTMLSLFAYPGPTEHLVLEVLPGDNRAADVVVQSLGSLLSMDLYTVDMTAGYEYAVIVSGDYTPFIGIVDSAGYLLVSQDGDDRGVPDGLRVDSEWFTPEYSGQYWITVAWQYVQGAVGSYAMVVSAPSESVGVAPPPPPPPMDAIAGTGDADILDGGDGADSIRGYSGDDTIRGLDGDDFVYGDDGNDDVNGNLGNDRVHGGPGNDFVRGGQGDDAVYGQEGDDWHVNGNIGNDTVFGGAGHDQVFGGPGDDTIYGEAGNDSMSGDLGNDLLYGGPDADHFYIASNGGWDIIADFNRAQGDKIVVEGGINGAFLYDAQQIMPLISTAGGAALIDFGNGTKLGLLGVAANSMRVEDFIVI